MAQEANDDDDQVVQESKYPETMIVKLVEYHDGTVSDNSKIIIVKSDDSIETIDLRKARVIHGDYEGVSSNLILLRRELQKWHNFGFLIKSSTSTILNTAVSVTTIFLEKN
jgi:hypothetical protein